MRVRLNGVRGSRPTHKRSLLGFGGNSTSIEIEVDQPLYLFVDGGSGLAHRGYELTSTPVNREFHFLITHTHWDHILGFPFFEPFYDPRNSFYFYASNTSRSTFEKLFFGLQRTENLPVPRHALQANVQFKTIHPGVPFTINDSIQVDTYQLNHQGITLGYRVTHQGRSACVITDNAPIANGNYLGEGMSDKAKPDPAAFESVFDIGLRKFLKDADLVVYDTHFTDKTIKPDWGHSTPTMALKVSVDAGVKRLILFHHAPEDTDADVDAKIRSVLRDGCRFGLEIEAAREGDIWTLDSA